jgi:F-type H+-transporting ATPase subunit epsilon
MKAFKLDIATPEGSAFSGSVQSVQVPGVLGSFQVLVNHAPIISTLGKGNIRIVLENGEEKRFLAQDGVIEVQNNQANILVEKLLEA